MNSAAQWVKMDTFKPCESLQAVYLRYNKLYFRNALPFVQVGYTKDGKWASTYGCTLRIRGAKFPFYIFINETFRQWKDTAHLTLLHEMIHVQYPVIGHGIKFKKERRRLILAGAFDDLI